MDESLAKWSLLPAEILSSIFQLAIEEDLRCQLCDFAVVCKAWLRSAQLVLYSKININGIQELRKFYNTMKNNVYLGEMVKGFHLNFRISEKDDSSTQKASKLEVLDYLAPLLSTHLPNLEEFSERPLESYTLLLDALLDGRLKKLKVLAMPGSTFEKSEVANYISCALSMKDRLENLLVSDNFLFEEKLSMEQLFFSRLYNKLDRFEKLTSILIRRKNNDTIQVLENVINSCKSLKEIEFHHTPNKNESDIVSSNSNNVSVDEVLSFDPANNIKALKFESKFAHDHNMLLYIIHKFPMLESLFVNMKNDSVSTSLMDQQILARLLNYLSTIEVFSVFNIGVDQEATWDTIEKIWKATSKPGSKRVEFTCKEVESSELQTSLHLLKPNSSSIASTSFTYYASSFHWRLINGFLRKLGMFIREMRLNLETRVVRFPLMINFIECTFTNCPNIKRLHIQRAVLKHLAHYTDTDFNKRLSIDELYLDNCILHAGILERWSLFIPEAKQMRLREIIYSTNATHRDPNAGNIPSNLPVLEIVMPYTKIDRLILDEEYANKRIYLKLYVLSQGTHYYYQLDSSTIGKISTVSRVEYENSANDKRIYICCQTKPDILF